MCAFFSFFFFFWGLFVRVIPYHTLSYFCNLNLNLHCKTTIRIANLDSGLKLFSSWGRVTSHKCLEICAQ